MQACAGSGRRHHQRRLGPFANGQGSGVEVVVAAHPDCGVCLMHMHRDPQSMQIAPDDGRCGAARWPLLVAHHAAVLRAAASPSASCSTRHRLRQDRRAELCTAGAPALELLGYPLLSAGRANRRSRAVTGRPVTRRAASGGRCICWRSRRRASCGCTTCARTVDRSRRAMVAELARVYREGKPDDTQVFRHRWHPRHRGPAAITPDFILCGWRRVGRVLRAAKSARWCSSARTPDSGLLESGARVGLQLRRASMWCCWGRCPRRGGHLTRAQRASLGTW